MTARRPSLYLLHHCWSSRKGNTDKRLNDLRDLVSTNCTHTHRLQEIWLPPLLYARSVKVLAASPPRCHRGFKSNAASPQCSLTHILGTVNWFTKFSILLSPSLRFGCHNYLSVSIKKEKSFDFWPRAAGVVDRAEESQKMNGKEEDFFFYSVDYWSSCQRDSFFCNAYPVGMAWPLNATRRRNLRGGQE